MAALGDGLMASPALALLKQRLPDHRICVLSRAHVTGYFRRLPFVDEVIPFADNRWLVRRKPWLALLAVPQVIKLFFRLRRERFAGVAQWRGQFIDTALSLATGAPVRVAAVQRIHRPALLPVERVPGAGIELVDAMQPGLHLVEAMAAPAQRLADRLTGQTAPAPDLRLHFPISPAEQAGAAAFLDRHGLARRGFAVLSISSKTTYNQWPAERFAAVARHLQEKHGLRIVLDALPTDEAKVALIASSLSTAPVNAVGLGLGEIAAVIGAARLVFCYNSAPMHLAAAAGTPVVVLGGRDGADIGPWRTPHRVVTRNEFYPRRHPDPQLWPELTTRVPADAVNQASDELLAEPFSS